MAQYTKGWVWLLAVAFSIPAHLKAQTTSSGSANTGQAASISAPIPEASAISGSLLVQTATTVNTADYRNTSGLYFGTIAYTIPRANGNVLGSVSTGYQTNYSYQGSPTNTLAAAKMPEGKSGDLVDPRIAVLRNKVNEAGFDTYAYGVKGTIAAISYSGEQASHSFSVGPHFNYTKNLGAFSKALSKFTFIQKVDYRFAHFHYKVQNNGKINNPHSFLLDNALDYTLGSRSGVSLGIAYDYRLSYQNVQKTALSAGIEFYYTLTDKWTLSLGVGNDTTGFATDGQTRELDILKPENASAYLNIDVKI